MNTDNSKNPAETEQGNIEPILKYNNMSKEKTLEDAIKALEKALDKSRLHHAKAYNRNQQVNMDLAEAICRNATDTLISLSAKYPCLLADPLPQSSNPIVRMTEILRRFKKARVKTPLDMSLMTSESIVLAVYADDPDLSMTEIAKRAGVNRTSLYRMDKFMSVRKMREKEEANSRKDAKPKGEKNGKTGEIEAWEK